ncbi:MAG: GlsB/YeaQ/YmgE family stress response membrane protein [Acidobacteria bacterium]|nr:MAG: GlsB/YeaQ/YmgE family stress response membrane protein [Acidobacteriota bacterium]
MHLIWTLVIGFLAGALAKWIMPGKDPGGFIVTTLLGVGGAFLGTFLGQLLGLYPPGGRAGFIGAVIGALIILAVYRQIKKKR